MTVSPLVQQIATGVLQWCAGVGLLVGVLCWATGRRYPQLVAVVLVLLACAACVVLCVADLSVRHADDGRGE